MRSFPALRLAAQLCLAAAVLCLFPPFRDFAPVFYLLPVLAFVGCLGATCCRGRGARLLWGLLPALSLAAAWAAPWPVHAALAALTAYTAACCALGRFTLALWQYRPEAAAMLLLSLLCVIVSGLGTLQSVPPKPLAAACVLFVLLAMRALRMGGASPAWQAGNVGLFVLPLLGGAAAGGLLWLCIPPLRWLFGGIAALFGGAVYLWNGFWGWLMGSVEIGDDFYETTAAVDPVIHASDWEAPTHTAPSGPARLIEGELPWQSILILLGGVALIFLAIWLLRRGAKPQRHRAPDELRIEEALPPEARTRRSRRARRAPRSEREKVRQLYREYLLFLEECGVHPQQSDTTGEISEAAAAILPETDELLRGLYRRARYSDLPVTPQECAQAEEMLARLTAKTP